MRRWRNVTSFREGRFRIVRATDKVSNATYYYHYGADYRGRWAWRKCAGFAVPVDIRTRARQALQAPWIDLLPGGRLELEP